MANYVKPTNRDKAWQFDDFFDDPASVVAFDPLGFTQMLGIQDTFWDPAWHMKKLGFAEGGSVGSFGNPFQMQAMMGQLSDAELAQVAQKPPIPGAQMLAVMELDKRNQMRKASGGAQRPSTTVLEDRVAQTMPVQQSGMAGDPIRSGLAAIMQQQQRPQQARPMAMGGKVKYAADGKYVNEYIDDLAALMPALAQHAPGPATPEAAMAERRQFAGEDRLAPFEAQLADRRSSLTNDRQRDRWLALAQAGFSLADRGDLGQAGLSGLEALRGADSAYNQGIDQLLARQMGLASNRQDRDDRLGGEAFSGFSGRRNALFESGLGAAANIGRTRESARDRSAANWRDTNDIQILADQLYQANRGQPAQRGGTLPDGRAVPGYTRYYSRDDAMRDAIATMSGGRGRGSSPDDLNEVLRAALFLADRANNPDPDSRMRASGIVDQIMSRAIGNTGSSTREAPVDTPSRGESTAAPPERGRGLASAPSGSASYDPASVRALQEALGHDAAGRIIGRADSGEDIIDSVGSGSGGFRGVGQAIDDVFEPIRSEDAKARSARRREARRARQRAQEAERRARRADRGLD